MFLGKITVTPDVSGWISANVGYINKFQKGDFLGFLQYFRQHCFICRPSDSTVLEGAGIAISALAVRSSNHRVHIFLEMKQG
jgi:hypothetical protein